ncbi:MAG: hypothetical protein HY822_22705 [Acidobacteria bacterium]|nr:hypothetical protein [Acidobacteriota bacterium]
MRNAKQLSLLLCLAALTLAAQDTRLAGPVSGVLFDPRARALRPVMGVLGAAYLGDALVADLDFAAVSPDGKLAVVVRNERAALVRGLDNGRLEQAGLESAAGVTRASWSADSTAVALWSGAGHLEVWAGLAASPRRTLAADLDTLAAVAVASEGRNAVAASESGAIEMVSDGASRRLLSLDRAPALAMAGGDLYVADAARNEIFALRNYAQAGDAQLFANAARGVNDAAALGISPDQRTLFVASRSGRSLTAFDLVSSEIRGVAELDFEPTSLERFTGSLYRLTSGGEGVPIQVLDSARALAVYFVPAEPASVVED